MKEKIAIKNKIETMLLLLNAIVIALMVVNVGLFLQMNRLQIRVIEALQPLEAAFKVPEGLPVASVAPYFNLSNINGQNISIDDLTDGNTLLVFSSTICSACKQMYPILKEFAEKHPEIPVLMISKGSIEDNRQMAVENKFDFQILNWEDDVVSAYSVPVTPYFYVIDADGMIAKSFVASSLEELERLVGE